MERRFEKADLELGSRRTDFSRRRSDLKDDPTTRSGRQCHRDDRSPSSGLGSKSLL
jgi:hypothetical protein